MLVTVSASLLFGAASFALIKSGKVGAGVALLVWLSGFTAASTGLAGPVNQTLTSLAAALH